MKKINRNVRVYLDNKTSNITIRFRWFSNNQNEINISLGNKWDLNKWDSGRQRPKLNTSCHGISYKEMCEAIENKINLVESIFAEFEIEEQIPNKQKLKEAISQIEGGKKRKRRFVWICYLKTS